MGVDFIAVPTPRPAEHRPEDEHANLVTHGLGFLLSLAAATVLMTQAIETRRGSVVLACTIYCCSLIGLYGASTLSHLFHDLTWRRRCRTLDQAFIYLLIAGSFTPVEVMILNRGWWPVLAVAMWTLALLGVFYVLRVGNLSAGARCSYGVLGWLPCVSLPELSAVVPREVLFWMIAGGICYSVGTIFLALDRRVRYFHALWHALVIAGSGCHYIAILMLVTGA